MNISTRGFGRYNNYGSFNGEPLNEAQLRRLAPSVFATEPHESRSTKFAHIPTYEIVQGLEREGFRPYSAKQGRSRIPGKAAFTKHMLRFRHDSQAVPTSMKDTVSEVILINAHDGTSQYKLGSAAMRIICLNGLICAGDGYEGVTVRHTGDAVDQVIEGAFSVLQQGPEMQRQIEDWSHVELTPRQRLAFAAGAHSLRFDDAKHTPDSENLLKVKRSDDLGSDLYTTMNVVQENVIRGGLVHFRPQFDNDGNPVGSTRARTRQVKGIDQDVKLNRALWIMAEAMRDGKTDLARPDPSGPCPCGCGGRKTPNDEESTE